MTPQPNNQKSLREELIEILADIEHQRWSDWFRYEQEKWSLENEVRWNRQASTSYSELSEKEKESDRREVNRYLPITISRFSELLEGLRVEEITPQSHPFHANFEPLKGHCAGFNECARSQNAKVDEIKKLLE